jgi:hypothetical protein
MFPNSVHYSSKNIHSVRFQRQQQQQQQQSLLSQARWGRLEMKPRMKTSELNPQRKQGKQR